MESSNLSRIGAIAHISGGYRQDGSIARGHSRSARAEMVLRELAKLQAQAAQLAAVIEANDDMDQVGRFAGEPWSSADIKEILEARLERNSYFPPDLFSDPAWDMLLDLYAAELAQVRVSVTSLCIASNASTSTALRWISALERKKLIERRADPLDGRRFFLSLSGDAVAMFERYFAARSRRSVI